jgi:hypothetical protein
MLSAFVNSKLTPKLRAHLKRNGLNYKVTFEHLIEKVKEVGHYEIIWKDDFPVDIKKIDKELTIGMGFGKYTLIDSNGYARQLFSSEYIEFSSSEFREWKLKKILK